MDIVNLFYNLIYWDPSYNKILFINLVIAIVLFTSLRWLSGIISHINPSKELFQKDNAAFGISLAGVVFAVTIVLTGAIYGDPVYNLEDSIIAVGAYGVLGIILLAITRFIFDKIALPGLSVRNEIVKGNIAVGIIDAGNVIATSIVIRAVMTWVETNTIEGIFAVIAGYVISQLLLTVATYVRVKMFAIQHEGKVLKKCLSDGNVALALRFAGRRIGTAFAIAAASNIMVYEISSIHLLLITWAFISILMIFVIRLLSFIADSFILYNIEVYDEIVNQKNAALGTVQGVIYISLGVLLAQLMA